MERGFPHNPFKVRAVIVVHNLWKSCVLGACYYTIHHRTDCQRHFMELSLLDISVATDFTKFAAHDVDRLCMCMKKAAYSEGNKRLNNPYVIIICHLAAIFAISSSTQSV